jgi:queuine/archaeosine tRNA-ribosyltransferase
MLDIISNIRAAIKENRFLDYRDQFYDDYGAEK